MSQRSLLTLCLCVLGFSISASSLDAGERPTLNKKTCDPRPDILPHPWYESRPEYRRTYNRPRYLSGWIAHRIAPTSQEAMVWCENLRAGAYEVKNSPPRYKRYFGPKPWEVLQTAARPDFARSSPQNASSPASLEDPAPKVEEEEEDDEEIELLSDPELSQPVPLPTNSQ